MFVGAWYLGLLENEKVLALCLGIAVCLSTMQIGFRWGRYHESWDRFLWKNQKAIFASGYSGKRRALIYLLAFSASNLLFKALFLITFFVQLWLLDLFFPTQLGASFFLFLLIPSAISGLASHLMSKRAEAWGEVKLNELCDFSFLFDDAQD
jgi:hypothetical protein